MDTVEQHRHIVRNLLNDYASVPALQDDVQDEAVFDEINNRYLLMAVGWDGNERIYAPIIHIDVIGGKVWLQCNNTNRDIADELVAAGIPRDDIVIGFRHPSVRQYTGYASG